MKRKFIALFDDQLVLVGPFESMSDLATWGRAWQADHADDPRWHSVDLEIPTGAVGHFVEIRKPIADEASCRPS